MDHLTQGLLAGAGGLAFLILCITLAWWNAREKPERDEDRDGPAPDPRCTQTPEQNYQQWRRELLDWAENPTQGGLDDWIERWRIWRHDKPKTKRQGKFEYTSCLAERMAHCDRCTYSQPSGQDWTHDCPNKLVAGSSWLTPGTPMRTPLTERELEYVTADPWHYPDETMAKGSMLLGIGLKVGDIVEVTSPGDLCHGKRGEIVGIRNRKASTLDPSVLVMFLGTGAARVPVKNVMVVKCWEARS